MSEFIENVQEKHGLFRNVPRILRRAVERRLARLEADAAQFDRAALVHHGRLKRLHALLHIKPGEHARTLFANPRKGSPRASLRELSKTKDPEAAAALVREHRLPYLLVEAALGSMPETVAVALVETLPPDELLARLPLLARRDVLKARVVSALRQRLAALAANPHARFPYQAIESVVRNASLDRQVAEALFKLIESPGADMTLTGDTALLLDVSGSMPREGQCLELAAQVGWRVDQVLDENAKLPVYLFGGDVQPVSLRRRSGLDQWRRALTVPVPAKAGTSAGAAVEQLGRDGHAVSRLLVVTDGYENRPPRLVSGLDRYRSLTGQRPAVNLVQPAETAVQLAVDLRNAQVAFRIFSVDRHLLGLDALLPALAVPSSEDRVAQILAYR
jgi:hypothetical protein